MPANILQYESDIWASADSLRSAGLKQSDFPKYMMPFFALRMVESRLIRENKRLSEEFGKSENNMDDYVEYFQTARIGYNDYVIRYNKKLSDITDIVANKTPDGDDYLTIYDPTCGGGNLLFGVEDKLKNQLSRPIKTHGMDWNSSLYALAKIESRFRTDSDIKYGNTLTDTAFIDKAFDVIVAKPPYGVDWKDYRKAIETDKTGRFVALPSISDGQRLFDQHIVYQLANDGIAVVVNNGSSLFSGDAGSGESNIRKILLR